MRNAFCLGNILDDSEQVLDNLAELLRRRVHELPASGYDECGSCTRFCQLNTAMTQLGRHLQQKGMNARDIKEYLARAAAQGSEPPFL